MLKKLFALVLCLCLLSAAGCSKSDDNDDSSAVSSEDNVSSQSSPEPQYYVNPLTGLEDLETAEKASERPVAIMINNFNIAQPVQTGLNAADVIYETEVEGGITRLMAVYQDLSRVGRIGTVRSARYAYVDLAMGHNAIYVHCGQDPTYCAPHLKDTDDHSLSENSGGMRVKNGLASEHTLYAEGNVLWAKLSDKFKTQNSATGTWQTFSEGVVPEGGTASTVTIPFSTSYKTSFTYDAATGRYTRSFNGTVRKDYISGENVTVKNVFVLTTVIKNYPDGEHRNISLTGGDGYYIVNGAYKPIKWSKGNASSPIKLTETDGTKLTVNPGNSWVCIAGSSKSQPTFG